jgi:hypothetical protein
VRRGSDRPSPGRDAWPDARAVAAAAGWRQEDAVIYVLELPEAGAPNAWFAYDDADFARKVAASDPLARDEIHDTLTVRELLAFDGAEPDAALRAAYPALCARSATPMAGTRCSTGPTTCSVAASAATSRSRCATRRRPLAARGAAIVYWTDDDALAAFEGGDPRVPASETGGRGGRCTSSSSRSTYWPTTTDGRRKDMKKRRTERTPADASANAFATGCGNERSPARTGAAPYSVRRSSATRALSGSVQNRPKRVRIPTTRAPSDRIERCSWG